LFLLKCTDAVQSNDKEGPYTALLAKVVRPKVTSTPDCHAVEYVAVDWLELNGSYIPTGRLELTPYPDGGEVALTVLDHSIGGLFHGSALFVLRVHDLSFDSSPFVGRVYIAEGSDGQKVYEPFAIRPNLRIPEHAYSVSLAKLGLSSELIDCFESQGILTAADLCVRSLGELLEIRNVGNQQLQEVRDRLAEARLWPWEDIPRDSRASA
jgi:Bacterial RNA polymerase, alpha chain C terminal domain